MKKKKENNSDDKGDPLIYKSIKRLLIYHIDKSLTPF